MVLSGLPWLSRLSGLSVLTTTAGESASASAGSAASAFAASLFVVLGDLLEPVILVLLFSRLGEELLVSEGPRRAIFVLSLLSLDTGALFLSRGLGFVDDDLFLELLLKLWEVLVSFSIHVVLLSQQTLQTAGELWPFLGGVSLLLLNRSCSLGPILVETFELVLGPGALSGSAHLADGAADGSLGLLLFLALVSKLREVTLGSNLLGLFELRLSLEGDTVLGDRASTSHAGLLEITSESTLTVGMRLLLSLASTLSSGGSGSSWLRGLDASTELVPVEGLLATRVLSELLLLLLLLDVLDLALPDLDRGSARVIFVGRDVVSRRRSLGRLSLLISLALLVLLLLLLLLLLQLLVLLLLFVLLLEEGA